MKYIALLQVDNDILIQGDGCCTNLQELYTSLSDVNTTEIEIRKDFADTYFTYEGLCDFVEYAAAVVPNIRISVADTVYDNLGQAVKDLQVLKHVDEFIYALETNPSKIMATIQSLCKHYTDAHDDALVASNKLATMSVQIEDLKKQLDYAKKDSFKLQAAHNDTVAKLHSLVSRVNFRYEKTIEPSNLFVTSNNNYSHILYIKEITRVHYTDTLVYYLQEILKTLYGVPVRSVVIEPYYAYSRAAMYPAHKPHWDLTYADIYSGDIFMAGYQPKVMKDIMHNPNKVHFLIVLDRGGYMAPHINSGNVSTVYTVSDLKDAVDIDKDKLISYDDSTMYIPYIENFDELSPEDKIKKYSSMNVTKQLINLLEGTS